jgi:small GTP-binding protein
MNLKFVFKITVIGDGGVGKTSLIKKYTEGTFEEDYVSTIGAQFSFYDEKIDGDECKLYFWDIAGQEEFEFLRSDFYEDSKAAIIVYSLEENDRGKESHDHIDYWYKDLKKSCGDIPIIIFSNKVDLINENKLDDAYIQNFIKEKNIIGVYRTSAKTNQGVTEAFQKIIKELYEKYKGNL